MTEKPTQDLASPKRVFEDIAVGEIHRAGPVTLTREAMIAFAEFYDPQPFHLDEAAAAASLLGGLAASGWQTAAVGMRLLFDGFVGNVASMGSPGIDELRWLKPVRPGCALSMMLTVTGTRASASRPDRGFVALEMRLVDDSGDVLTQRFSIIVQRRGVSQTYPVREPQDVQPPAGDPIPDPDLVLSAFFDDVPVGHRSTLGAQHVSAELIVAFASLYDPQPFHLDSTAARQSHFGGLCASGWQTAAFWMKHYVAARRRSAEARANRGLPVAIGGPSPGFARLKWLHPARAGMVIRYGLEVTDKRKISRPGWGLVETLCTGHSADGTLVFSFEGRLLWPCDADCTVRPS